ncbi:hypothetical protein JCM8208_002977 [Rhodotorula glutinis]
MSAVTTRNAEDPGPFLTQAVLAPAGPTLYVSGQCGVDPATGKCVEGTCADRAVQVLKNLEQVLKAADMDLGDIVMAQIYLTNHAEDMEPVNEVYMKAFEGCSPMPARICIGVAALPMGTDVEIACTAVKRSSS